MLPRRPLILLLAAPLAVSIWSCAPTVSSPTTRMWGKPDDQYVIDNLSKDHALGFLRSLYVPETATSCRFEEDGVLRWSKGQLLPGKTPYSSLYISGLGRGGGPPVRYVLSVRETNELWCAMQAQLIADRQGKDVTPFLNQIYTALRVMGARVMPVSELPKAMQLPSWREAVESVRLRQP